MAVAEPWECFGSSLGGRGDDYGGVWRGLDLLGGGGAERERGKH